MQSLKNIFVFHFVLLFIYLISFDKVFAIDTGSLQMGSIIPVQTQSKADNSFENGWRWTFNVTVPENETILKMKFTDWTDGNSKIQTAGNVRYWSPQSLDSNSASTAKLLSVSNTYGEYIKLSSISDLSPSIPGRQIQIIVEVKIPEGSSSGSYSSSYGINTEIDTNQATGVLDAQTDPTYSSLSYNNNQTNVIIGKLLISAKNENVKLNSFRIGFGMATNTNNFYGLQNIKAIWDDGINLSATNTNWYPQINTNDFVINSANVPAINLGETHTLTIRSDISFLNGLSSASSTLVKTYLGSLPFNAQGMSTNKAITVLPNNFQFATITLTNLVDQANLPTVNLIPIVHPSSININASSTVNIWDTNLIVSKGDVNLNTFSFNFIGSAPKNVLSNIHLFVDKTEFGHLKSFDESTGKIVIWDPTGKVLSTGSHLVELSADVVSGSGRSFIISSVVPNDFVMYDNRYGVQISPVVNGSSSTSSLFGQTILINYGSLVVAQDSSFNNVFITPGTPQATLGSFKFTAYGEDIKITSLPFMVVGGGFTPSATDLANVGLYVNGAHVGVSQNVNISSGNVFVFSNLGSNLIIPAGQSVIVSIRGDARDSSGVPYTSGNIAFNLQSGQGNAQGIYSQQTFSTNSVSGQTLSFLNNVTFGVTSGFGASVKPPNSSAVKIGSFTMQVGSAEGVNINRITVGLAGSMIGANQIYNLTIKDGSTVVGTPIGNPAQGDNIFSTNISLPVNTTKTFDVYAELGSGSVGLVVIPSMLITYRGILSNISGNTNDGAPVIGPTTTSGLPIIGVSIVKALSPIQQFIIGGASSFNIGVINISSLNNIAGAVVRDMVFKVPQNTISSVTLNGVTSAVIGDTAKIFGLNINVPTENSGINVSITVQATCVGLTNGCALNSPASTSLIVDSLNYSNGVNSVILSNINQTTNEFQIVGSKPTLSITNTVNSGLVLGTENKIGEFTVSADNAGNIKVNQIDFNISNSGFSSSPTISNPRIADGNITVSGTTCTGAVLISCTFGGGTPNGYVISAGTSKTFSLYANINGVATGSNSASVSTSLISSGFIWDDIIGGGTNITGNSIYNFPTNSYTRRQ